jgi:hypothetical protein
MSDAVRIGRGLNFPSATFADRWHRIRIFSGQVTLRSGMSRRA